MLSRVLLPQPLGPIRATTSPSATEKLTSRIAVSPCVPEASAKRMVTLRYSRRTTGDIEQTFPNERRSISGSTVWSARVYYWIADGLARVPMIGHHPGRHGRASRHSGEGCPGHPRLVFLYKRRGCPAQGRA